MVCSVPSAQNVLGIIAGSGNLPFIIVQSCRVTGRSVFVLAVQGQTDPRLVREVPHAWIRLGAAMCGLRLLRKAGVQEVVLTGAIRRPSLRELRPDRCTMGFLAKAGIQTLGDDGALKAVIQHLEAEGFRIVGVEDVVDNLMAPSGRYGECTPNEKEWEDIRLGIDIINTIGIFDIGHSIVIQQKRVLAVEAAEGTDAMLARCRNLVHKEAPGGVLVKVCKPGQERRTDLPTIGITTINNVVAAGLRGIAVEAGGTLIINKRAVIEQANRLGLFVIGVPVAKTERSASLSQASSHETCESSPLRARISLSMQSRIS